jgi:hypothetical protein
MNVKACVRCRDGPINPSRGSYAGLSYRAFFEGFLGGASNW